MGEVLIWMTAASIFGAVFLAMLAWCMGGGVRFSPAPMAKLYWFGSLDHTQWIVIGAYSHWEAVKILKEGLVDSSTIYRMYGETDLRRSPGRLVSMKLTEEAGLNMIFDLRRPEGKGE